MWFLLLYLQILAVQGFNVALRGSSSPCRGRLEVYNQGEWGLVCHHEWTKANGEVVCKSLGCGEHVSSDIEQTLYQDPSQTKKYWMDQVKCTSKENSLWDCPRADPKNINCKKGFIAVHCSGNVTLRLNLNGQRNECAGVVEFSTPHGIVGVCNSGWDEKKATVICKELKCGDHYYIPSLPGQPSQPNVRLNCIGNEKFSWQCMERLDCQDRASVYCTMYRWFHLKGGDNVCSGSVEEFNVTSKSWEPLEKYFEPDKICTQLNCGLSIKFTRTANSYNLTCSGNVTLHLKRNDKLKCFGDISVNVNGSDYGVCFSNSDPKKTLLKKVGNVVCQELGCGEVVEVKEGSGTYNEWLSNVECQDHNMHLWHCLANHGKNQCRPTNVICSDSLKVRLRDGLGDCSGRVEVNLEGMWKSVYSDLSSKSSDVVCQKLGCGKSASKPKLAFSESTDIQQSVDSKWSVQCLNSVTELHQCFKEIQSRQQNMKIMKIICKQEELMYLEGDTPCQGRVRIKSFDDSKQVTDYKKNVSNVCTRMNCGHLISFENKTTYTNINCSGSVSVKLQNPSNERCWGTVQICPGNKPCGRVCGDKWTFDDSKMICENLGCGSAVPDQGAHQMPNNPSVHYSVYCAKEVKIMSMCTFITDNDKCDNPAQVICTDSIKARLEDPRDKCAGRVSLFYGGNWTPICRTGLNDQLRNTVCRDLNCGEAESDRFTTSDETQITGLSPITCKADARSVDKCDFKQVSKSSCSIGYLKCTEWRRLLFYKQESQCRGPVYMYAHKEPLLVIGDGWREEEGKMMCKNLQCGNYLNTSHSPNPETNEKWWNKTYNCSGKSDIWGCESSDKSSRPQKHLNIVCDGKKNVRLSYNCSGEVLVNETNICAPQESFQMANELCHSLHCGNAIHHWSTPVSLSDHWDASCTGSETQLWQCSITKAKCRGLLSVACEKNFKFSSTEKCGGKVVVKFRDQWEYVCGANGEGEKKLCDQLDCNGEPVDEQDIKAGDMMVTIECSQKDSFTQCIKLSPGKCTARNPVEIRSCPGYSPRTNYAGLIVGLLLGLLGLLGLVYMWINRKRLLLLLRQYRNRYGKSIDGSEMDDMEKEDGDLSEGKASFLNDDYEDVDSVVNKSGEEEEEEEDEDDRRRGSSGTEYDDVEGQTSGISPNKSFTNDDLNRPLLPKRPDNILADQDTYEVETEKQDDYDDAIPVPGAPNEKEGTSDPEAEADVDEDAGAESDSGAGTAANGGAVVVTTEAEIHAHSE